MKKKLELKLVEKYPTIFQEYHKDPRESAMGMGIACGSGWYELIDNLCNELQQFPEVVAVQVKEKFGGLRFYTGKLTEQNAQKVFDIISKYEGISFKTCELCGKPGSRRGDGWIRTLCTPCQQQRDLSIKITNGTSKYKINNVAGVTEIKIYDDASNVIFKGELPDFMKLVAPRLALEEVE